MSPRKFTRNSLALVVVLLWTSLAAAQGGSQIQPGTPVVVTTEASVFLRPDPTRDPLRKLAVGTTAVAQEAQAGWIRITFSDPQYGPRTGWIESRFVKVDAAPEIPSPARPRQTPNVPETSRQPRPQASRPASPRRSIPAFRVFGTGAFDQTLAAESFNAITGSDTIAAFGGGIQVADVWSRLFVEFGAEYSSVEGERVFVFDNQVVPLGIPVNIKTLPLDLVGGWRVPSRRVASFVGGGATFMRYEETSDFAENEENLKEWHPGFVAFGGVETRVMPNLHVRVDVRYRRVSGALGESGVSAVFGERDLGGTGVSFKVVFGR